MVSKKFLVLLTILVLAVGFFGGYPAVYVNTQDQTFLFGHPIDKPQCSGEEALFGCQCVAQMSLSSWVLLSEAPPLADWSLRLETLPWVVGFYSWPFTLMIGYDRFMGCP